MYYISTRGKSSPQPFKEILLEGLAPDGGLYMPDHYPTLDLDSIRGGSYIDVALHVLSMFATDISLDELRTLLEQTYTAKIFGDEHITPFQTLERNLHLLHLSNGPTLAFKDVPLQLLGALMEKVLSERGEELNVLGATSGDTGSAAACALKGRKGLRLFMLSPHGRMSPFQQMQMYTLNESNIFNLVVNGTFDDCQTVVKEVNADADFKKKYKLGAVNSINWARIAAQVVYYVYGYLRATTYNSPYAQVTFAVPSGNFGNALSAYIAMRMGLPINIIVCTNENDVLHEFFQTGVYRVRKGSEVKVTSSPSMDIAMASNFERFMFDWTDRKPFQVRNLWRQLAKNGAFNVGVSYPGQGFGITSGRATEHDVLATIRLIYRKHNVIIDPHTAVAMCMGLCMCDLTAPLVVTETAQPAKFAETIKEALGFEAAIPERYKSLADLPQYTTRIDPDPEVVKRFIAAHVV